MIAVEDKRYLVVGASTGIGREVAEMLSARGARVCAVARRPERLEGLDAVPIAGDVSSQPDCRRMVGTAVEELGGLDGLVYCVGMSVLGPLADATLEDWHRVFDTNVFGASFVVAEAAPHLLASGGRAVLLSSKATRRPFPDLSLYVTSKLALDGLIRCLPVEFPGLEVCRVVVGNTAGTDFHSEWDPEALAAALDKWVEADLMSDMGLMHPRQVASAVVFALAGPVFVDEVAVIERPVDDGTFDRTAFEGR